MDERRSIIFEVPGQPVQFARAGSRGAQRFTPQPQRNYMTAIASYAAVAMGSSPPMDGPVELTLCAEYLAPKSWPKKRRDATEWKSSSPDLDNIIKIAKDALNTIAYQDDAQVALLGAIKRYGPQARLIIRVAQI